MTKPIVEMVIESVTMECWTRRPFVLTGRKGYDPDFKTGQFITLFWPDTPNYKRAYSLSSCAPDRGFYEVTANGMEDGDAHC